MTRTRASTSLHFLFLFLGLTDISLPSQVHKLCQESAQHILDEFKPNLMVAIGGGGYVPARILRYAFHARRTSCTSLYIVTITVLVH